MDYEMVNVGAGFVGLVKIDRRYITTLLAGSGGSCY